MSSVSLLADGATHYVFCLSMCGARAGAASSSSKTWAVCSSQATQLNVGACMSHWLANHSNCFAPGKAVFSEQQWFNQGSLQTEEPALRLHKVQQLLKQRHL